MTYSLPTQVLHKLQTNEEITLELGCGPRKRHPDALGVDLVNYPGVDIVGDIHEVISVFPDLSVSGVFTDHCLEHLIDLKPIVVEVNRILKPNAVLKVVTPHFSNPYFYSDYTHKSFFGLYTFCYFARCSLFKRTVPRYDLNLDLRLDQVRLIFKSPYPFYLRHGTKKIFEKLFNINSYTMEWYEENFCYIIPCYEIEYLLRKL